MEPEDTTVNFKITNNTIPKLIENMGTLEVKKKMINNANPNDMFVRKSSFHKKKEISSNVSMVTQKYNKYK